MPNWRKIITSGSDASLNSLSANTYVSASSFSGNLTGSVFGTSSWAITASYAITSSYGLNPYISGSLNNVNAVVFNTASSVASAPGVLTWDNGEGTLQLGLAGGNVAYKVGEDLYQYVYNAQGTTLSKGQVVYGSGSQGGRIAVKLASATAELGSANTIGLIAETITAGSEGWIITEGTLKNINTSQFTTSPFVYLSSSAGEYTPNYPEAPSHGVRLGLVQKVDATTGAIYVKIDNGYELEELHDVVDTSTTSSYGDLLIKSGSIWTNSKQLTGSYFVTGTLQATSFTGSLLGTSSYASQALTSSYALTASYALNGGGGGAGTIRIADEGTFQDSAALLDFSGTGVSVTVTSNTASISITGGGGSSFPYTGSAIISGSLQVTGSVSISSGSFTVTTGSGIEFQVTDTGTKIGNLVTDRHTVTGSLDISGSITGSLLGSASYALTASYALNGGGGSSVGYFGANFDGQGAALLINTTAYFRVPRAGTITAWSIVADGTWPTSSLNIWKTGSGASIPTSANSIISNVAYRPFISASRNAIRSTDLTTWTASFAANDIFAVTIISSSVATKLNLTLECTWT